MNQELIDPFKGLEDRLGAKFDLMDRPRTNATPAPGGEVPPGMVAVRPTGAHGLGKVRFWPALATDGVITEGPWSYAERLAKMKDPATGKPFWITGRDQIVSMTCSARSASTLSIPEAIDFLTYPDDWLTLEELEQAAAARIRDAGASWGGGSR